MLINQKKLEDGDVDLLDPSFLLDQNVISVQKTKPSENLNSQSISWMNSFEEINLESVILFIKTTLQEFFRSFRANGFK